MRQRLRTAGIRPISNLVDVTNYVMLELGQPLHAFDLDQVRGERIVVRRAGPGERLRTLDGIDRILTTEDLVVADGEAAAALAGTMGGEGSEVGPGTSRVLIEAAAWDAPTVMHMSRRHGLRSEASARFERGVDPNLPPVAAARAARLRIELAGGETLAGWVDEVAVPKSPWQVMLPISEVTRLLGDHFGPGEVAGLLRRLHLEVQGEDPLTVTVPTYRPDLTRPVDLVEEIARLWGYDRFPETVPTGGAGGWSPQQRRRLTIRRALTGAGLHEALNLSFLGPQDLEAMAYPTGHEGRMVVRVTNPLNEELASLRTSLLPGLLRSLAFNAGRGIGSVALFEIGRVFLNRPWEGEDSRVPDQPERLGYALMGGFGPSGLDHNPPPVDLFTATALWRLLARRLGIGYYRLIPASPPGFHPGRAAEVVVNGRSLGFVGEVNPATASAYGLTGRVAAGELSLAPLVEAAEPWQFVEPSLFPPVEFDLAFEMPDRVAAATLLETTAAEARDLLESVFVFDEFRGGGLAAGRKSLALHYVLRAPDRTLTSQEAGEVRARMIAAVAPLGATLRGA
jgi:phenylalanyl-tRNA synthetase beta chain